jgi:hypothetical protein
MSTFWGQVQDPSNLMFEVGTRNGPGHVTIPKIFFDPMGCSVSGKKDPPAGDGTPAGGAMIERF